jgi:hypothetical protein
MVPIIKKNMSYYAGYMGFILLLTVIVRAFLGNELNVPFVIVSGILVFMLVFGAVFINEQYEEKSNGYDFLDVLPVKASEIVAAKFSLVLLADVAIVGYLLLLFSSSVSSPEEWTLVRSYILMSGVLCLIFTAVSYLGIFAIGYTKFVMIVLSLLVVLGFFPLLITKFYRDNLDTMVENILAFLQNLNWIVILPLSLVGYLGLMWIAVKIKE